jgi:hypothetical protein
MSLNGMLPFWADLIAASGFQSAEACDTTDLRLGDFIGNKLSLLSHPPMRRVRPVAFREL